MTHYLSSERLAELKAEYQELVTVRRMEVADRLKKAKEFGDLSENSEYNEAKDEQSQVERRIIELEDVLKNAEVIIKSEKRDIVGLGSVVEVKRGDGMSVVYTIVGSQEVDPDQGKISNESPVGAGLLGHKAGETVTVNTAKGKVDYTIKSIK